MLQCGGPLIVVAGEGFGVAALLYYALYRLTIVVFVLVDDGRS